MNTILQSNVSWQIFAVGQQALSAQKYLNIFSKPFSDILMRNTELTYVHKTLICLF